MVLNIQNFGQHLPAEFILYKSTLEFDTTVGFIVAQYGVRFLRWS
jgi:hypothetical protein